MPHAEAPAIERLQHAISEGDVDEFHAVLNALNPNDKKELLQRKYGRLEVVDEGGSIEDEKDPLVLPEGTSPILHAARMGNTEMLSAVLGAMKTNKVRIRFGGKYSGRTNPRRRCGEAHACRDVRSLFGSLCGGELLYAAANCCGRNVCGRNGRIQSIVM